MSTNSISNAYEEIDYDGLALQENYDDTMQPNVYIEILGGNNVTMQPSIYMQILDDKNET